MKIRAAAGLIIIWDVAGGDMDISSYYASIL
jgi:hypothetical protein